MERVGHTQCVSELISTEGVRTSNRFINQSIHPSILHADDNKQDENEDREGLPEEQADNVDLRCFAYLQPVHQAADGERARQQERNQRTIGRRICERVIEFRAVCYHVSFYTGSKTRNEDPHTFRAESE